MTTTFVTWIEFDESTKLNCMVKPSKCCNHLTGIIKETKSQVPICLVWILEHQLAKISKSLNFSGTSCVAIGVVSYCLQS